MCDAAAFLGCITDSIKAITDQKEATLKWPPDKRTGRACLDFGWGYFWKPGVISRASAEIDFRVSGFPLQRVQFSLDLGET